MKIVVQRVSRASVIINSKVFSQINSGFLILLGVKNDDNEEKAERLANKVNNLRIMSDKNGKMNLNLKDTGGEALVVSQFTLYADCSRGNRPSFVEAAKPDKAKKLYEFFIDKLRSHGLSVKTGSFGSLMEVNLMNDGPVTIVMDN